MSNEEQAKPFRKLPTSFLIVLFILFVLTIIAVPNFMRYQVRDPRSEAKQNLGALFTAYTAYHADNGTYPTSPSIQIGSTSYNCLAIADLVPTVRRYSYECVGNIVYWPRWETGTERPLTHCPVAITGATRDSYTVAACGSFDNDPTNAPFFDVWTIDDAKHIRHISDGYAYSWRARYHLWRLIHFGF